MSKGNLSSSLTTDDALIAAIRSGDERALAHLYRLHWPMVSHFVLQNSGSEDDAQDIYQEGVMVFYEKVRDGSLELSCQIKTYLYAVCRRLWLKRLTGKSRFGVRLLDDEEHGPYLHTGAEDDLLAAEEQDRRFATMSEALITLLRLVYILLRTSFEVRLMVIETPTEAVFLS